MVWQTKILACI